MIVEKNKLAEAYWFYFHNPVRFVTDIIGAEPEPYQAEILNAIVEVYEDPKYNGVAVRSGHGVGKTALTAWAGLWFVFTRPFAKVPCTAPTKHQLYDILWPEFHKWIRRSQILKDFFVFYTTRIVVKGYEEEWFIVARTSNKPENMQGFHGENLLFIVEEASGVDDEIMQVVDGALTTEGAKALLVGNPTRLNTYFHHAFTKDRASWKTFHISCFNSNRVSPQYAERMAKKWGKDSNIYRVRVLGEFPLADDDAFIPLHLVELAANRKKDVKPSPGDPIEIGADIARFGDDETVIYVRHGMKVVDELILRKKDTMEVAGEIARMIEKWWPSRVKIDQTGIGSGVVDRLREIKSQKHWKLSIIGIDFGSAARDKQYANKGTEMWAVLKEILNEAAIPNDEELIGQLSSRKYKINSKGQIVLESKEEMKKRGLRSPDRADALALTFYPEYRLDVRKIEPVGRREIVSAMEEF